MTDREMYQIEKEDTKRIACLMLYYFNKNGIKPKQIEKELSGLVGERTLYNYISFKTKPKYYNCLSILNTLKINHRELFKDIENKIADPESEHPNGFYNF